MWDENAQRRCLGILAFHLLSLFVPCFFLVAIASLSAIAFNALLVCRVCLVRYSRIRVFWHLCCTFACEAIAPNNTAVGTFDLILRQFICLDVACSCV